MEKKKKVHPLVHPQTKRPSYDVIELGLGGLCAID